ncbi:MAG: hypothetical protein FWC23_00545 [Chitinispirillia bacterium]|nr:hypothetical protein [Chitinispirillia bacterium]MCL2267663.1 hypothetical protein [Chitinispirillia bacterium]
MESGVRKFNFRRMVRVFIVTAALWVATLYITTGENPFAERWLLRVSGDAGGYAVSVLSEKLGRDTLVLWSMRVDGALPADSAAPLSDTYGAAKWRFVRPFADSTGAALLTFSRASVLICDSLIFGSAAGGRESPFREKLDMVIVPAAGDSAIWAIRERFRPRIVAVAAPCSIPAGRNIICGAAGSNGEFSYDFRKRSGGLRLIGK